MRQLLAHLTLPLLVACSACGSDESKPGDSQPGVDSGPANGDSAQDKALSEVALPDHALEAVSPEAADSAADSAESGPPASAVYVSTTGDDNAPGTYDQPVRTFAQALKLRSPKDEVRVFAGTYTERLVLAQGGTAALPLRVAAVPGQRPVIQGSPHRPVEIAGSFVEVEGFEVTTSENQCVYVEGSDVVVRDLWVRDAVSHGVLIAGSRVVVEGCRISNTVLENEGAPGGGWGSALKVGEGASDITLRRNQVFHNWGEGIAVTKGANVRVQENWSYDNFSVGIYIDNSHDVVVEGNLVTCVPNSGFEREGKPCTAIALGEESYAGWGAQSHNITIQNNLAAFCGGGIAVWSSDVGGSLSGLTIVHNTLWGGSETALSFDSNPVTGTVLVANNLVQQPEGNTVYIDNPSGIQLSNNFWVNGTPEDWRNGSGPGDRTGDPGLFGAPNRTAISFRLAESSTARDGAKASVSPSNDFEGRVRATSDSPGTDMGAMEFGDPTSACAFDELWQ